MVKEVRVDCVGFVVLTLHYLRRGPQPGSLQGAVPKGFFGRQIRSLVERDDRRQVVVWCQIGRVLKRVEHWGCHQIELGQRLRTQDVLDRAIDVLGCVRRVDRLALSWRLGAHSIWTDDKNRLTVTIHVIDAAL
jgi:hypothetical protein